MKPKKRCEIRREKPIYYLSATRISGLSYQKCGRVAVFESEYGMLLCAKCSAEYPFKQKSSSKKSVKRHDPLRPPNMI